LSQNFFSRISGGFGKGLVDIFDIALGIGGLPRGRVVEIYGSEASGKTTLALQSVANVQATGGVAAYIDVEHAIEEFMNTPDGEGWTIERVSRVPADNDSKYKWIEIRLHT
jgi:RecA/RadA recombinase